MCLCRGELCSASYWCRRAVGNVNRCDLVFGERDMCGAVWTGWGSVLGVALLVCKGGFWYCVDGGVVCFGFGERVWAKVGCFGVCFDGVFH